MLNIDDRLLNECDESELFLLLQIARHVGSENESSFPGNKRLMLLTGWRLTKVKKVKANLIANGMISSKIRFDEKGSQTSNLYTIETDYLGVFRSLKGKALNEDKGDGGRSHTRPGGGRTRDRGEVAHATPNILINEVLINEPKNIPVDEKSTGVSIKSSWTKSVATLFDRVSEEEHKNAKVEHEPLNWIAGAGRQFNALKMLKKSLISDIERKQQRQATEEELMSSFEYLFRYAFRYLAKISHDRGGAIQFTPAIILNNYNNALQYARQEHRTSKSNGDASRRDAFQKIIESACQSDIE